MRCGRAGWSRGWRPTVWTWLSSSAISGGDHKPASPRRCLRLRLPVGSRSASSTATTKTMSTLGSMPTCAAPIAAVSIRWRCFPASGTCRGAVRGNGRGCRAGDQPGAGGCVVVPRPPVSGLPAVGIADTRGRRAVPRTACRVDGALSADPRTLGRVGHVELPRARQVRQRRPTLPRHSSRVTAMGLRGSPYRRGRDRNGFGRDSGSTGCGL